MLTNPRFRLLKNSLANVLRGSSTSIVAMVLPSFLTRSMTPVAYGLWMLVLQLSAYVNYLDFGIQTAIGRFVAHAEETRDADHRNSVVSTSFFILSILALCAVAASAGVSILLPKIFVKIPPALIEEGRFSLLLVSGTIALGLPVAVFNSVFVGLHKNEVPAGIIGAKNLALAAALVWVAHRGGSIIQMAIATSAVSVLSYGGQYLAYRHWTSGDWIAIRYVSRTVASEIASYCKSLSIWSFSILLIMGLDLTLVGIFDFTAVPYYAVAAVPTGILIGLQNAIFTATVPYTAMLHARGDRRELSGTVLTGARYGMLILLATGLPLLLATFPVLKLWVGVSYARRVAPLLQVLVVANILRSSATPYIAGLIGTGEQRLVTVSPILEAFTNVLFSILLGLRFGAIGVAWGTLIGSVIGLAGHFFYNMQRTKALGITRTQYFRELARAIFCVSPLCVFYFGWPESLQNRDLVRLIYFGFPALGTIWLTWKYGLAVVGGQHRAGQAEEVQESTLRVGGGF